MNKSSESFGDFSGVTFKVDALFGFIPRYTVHIPHKTMSELVLAKDAGKAIAALAAYILALPGTQPAAAGLAIFAAWLTVELYLIKWADKGSGVNLTTWISPFQPYWIPTSA